MTMIEQSTDTELDENKQSFRWVDRYLKPVEKLGCWVDERPTARVEFVYWMLALLSIVPALRAELLFPIDWSGGIGLDYTVSWFDKTFSLLQLQDLPYVRLGIISLVLSLIAFVLFVIAFAQRSYVRLIVILPFFTIALPYLAIHLGVFMAKPTWLFVTNAVYACSAFATFLYFIVAGRLGSSYFVLFVLLLGFYEPFDDILGWKQIIGFIAASMVSSFIYEIARQNIPLLKQIGRAGALSLLARSFSLWSPNLILIMTGLWIGHQLTSGTEQMLYDQGVVTPYCVLHDAQPEATTQCPREGLVLTREAIKSLNYDSITQRCDQKNPRSPRSRFSPTRFDFGCPANFFKEGDEAIVYRLSREPFIVSLNLTIDDKFGVAQEKLRRAQKSFDNAAFRNPLWVELEARRMFSFVPRSTGLTEKECDFLDLNCDAANLVKRILNGAYADIRRRAEQRFVANAIARAEAFDKHADATANTARKEIESELVAMKLKTKQTVYGVYQTSKVVQILLIAWLIVIMFKSFLYVFSRVIFDKETDIHVDLLEHHGDAQQGTVRHLQEIMIPDDYPHTIYYKPNFQPLGPAPRFSIPQWRSSILSRMRFGAWNMNRIDMPLKNQRGLTFNAIEAEYLVDWELEEGEEIIFKYGNFVAMNENVELRTVISLRVATMLMGRFIFHTARCKGGPGRLILRTRGKPATEEQVRQSIPASRLIAWNRYARFSVDSHLTRADIFLNGFNLRRSEVDDENRPQGIIVVEADARSGNIMVGTLRFAKHFLLPV